MAVNQLANLPNQQVRGWCMACLHWLSLVAAGSPHRRNILATTINEQQLTRVKVQLYLPAFQWPWCTGCALLLCLVRHCSDCTKLMARGPLQASKPQTNLLLLLKLPVPNSTHRFPLPKTLPWLYRITLWLYRN